MLSYSYKPSKNPIPYLFMTKRHIYVRSILKNSQVLDLGCNKYKIVSNAVGMDINKDVKPDILGTVLHLPIKDEYFDTVVALELIEHMRCHYQDILLDEIHRILKPKGQLIVSTPNISEATRKLHDFLFYISHSIYAREDVGKHIGELTHFQLKNKLIEHGFKLKSDKAF